MKHSRAQLAWTICLAVVILGGIAGNAYFTKLKVVLFTPETKLSEKTEPTDLEPDESVPGAVPVQAAELSQLPADTSGLGGYNVLIADRGNNRIIEVTPDKKIVWEYKFDLPTAGLGADDAFFTNGGRDVIVNLENNQEIRMIDYKTKQVVWQYGHAGVSGSKDGYLSNPDDAYRLPNGNITVADIKNCRILEISPDKKIVGQYGTTKVCGNSNGLLNKPNGDTPLQNGHMFISNIVGHDLIELDQNKKQIFSMVFPLTYPSDPQLMQNGDILISEYRTLGKILEMSRDGNVVWEFTGENGVRMNKPSLAIELPNGNILSNDDYNHRVIVIDKKTKKIVWQYGVTGKPGVGDQQLNVPDGLDIIQHLPVTSIGSVTRHAANYLGKRVLVEGFLLKADSGSTIVSDEQTGMIGVNDLPVIGSGFDSITPGVRYLFEGIFVKGSVTGSSTKNSNHLELIRVPEKTL